MKEKFFYIYFFLSIALLAGIALADMVEEYRGTMYLGRLAHITSIAVESGKTLDTSAATVELPNGTDLPATCDIGDVFVDSDDNACADAGSGTGAVCVCTAADTWTEVS